MCGISAAFETTECPQDIVKISLKLISHRGSEKANQQHGRSWGLGTVRLPIVDSQENAQPAKNSNATVFCCFNGQIFNYRELRKILEGLGHKFSQKGDAEVIVHAYEEWGEKFPSFLNGQFSIVLYDRRKKRWLACRDRLGIKPLYYCRPTSGGIIFSSEIKGLLPFSPIRVSEVEKSTLLTDVGESKYWQLGNKKDLGIFRNSDSILLQNLEDSIRLQTRGLQKAAVFLSGGVDSSLMLSLLRNVIPKIDVYSVGFNGSPDLFHANLICDYLNLNLNTVKVTEQMFQTEYKNIIRILESALPNLIPSSIFSFILCKAARRDGHDVAFVGEGADELLFGYNEFAGICKQEANRLRINLLESLSNTQLKRWDRVGMANTLEIRVPYLDHRLVESALQESPNQDANHRSTDLIMCTKAELRKIASTYLPSSIAYRKKMPMDVGVCTSEEHLHDLVKNFQKSNIGGYESQFEDSYRFNRTILKREYGNLIGDESQLWTKEDMVNEDSSRRPSHPDNTNYSGKLKNGHRAGFR